MYRETDRQTSQNYNELSVCISDLLDISLFTACHYLENFVFDEVTKFLIVQHHREINMQKEWTF